MSDKPTKGPWTTDEHEHDCPNQNIFVQAKGRSICKVWIGDACFDLNGEQRANARLIAEAGTVYHETRKTPREMQEQIEQMREALQELLADVVISQNNMRDAAKYNSRWEGCAEAIQPRVDQARAALSAAERKT